jgi:hypothetical protein
MASTRGFSCRAIRPNKKVSFFFLFSEIRVMLLFFESSAAARGGKDKRT